MYKKVLHATDLSSEHFVYCKKAYDIARALDSTFYLLHVIEPPASLQLAQGLGFAEFDRPNEEDAQCVLNTVADALGLPLDQTMVRVGSMTSATQTVIQDLGCDLLIIGHHEVHHFSDILENHAKSLLDAASCDVMTLK